MNKVNILDSKGNKIDANFVFSFHCDETMKSYVVIDHNNNIFDKSSIYNNLDVLEIFKEDNSSLFLLDVSDSDWEKVKNTIQNKIFKNMNK